jgi:hypothetical protein
MVAFMRRLMSCTIGLIVAGCISGLSAYAQTNLNLNQSEISIDRQQLSGASLRLDIRAASSSTLSGSVQVNGEIFAIQGSRSMDLNQCLNVATCEVEVTISARPTDRIELKIYSTNGAVNFTQQSDSVDGLQQKLTLNLR